MVGKRDYPAEAHKKSGKQKQRGKASSAAHREEYLLRMGEQFEAARRATLLQRLGGLTENEVWHDGGVRMKDQCPEGSTEIPNLFETLPASWQIDRLTSQVAPTAVGLPASSTLLDGEEITVVALTHCNGESAFICETTDEKISVDQEDAASAAADAGDDQSQASTEPQTPTDGPSLYLERIAPACWVSRSGLCEPIQSWRRNGVILVKDFTLAGTKGKLRQRDPSPCARGWRCFAPTACRACTGVPYPCHPWRRCGQRSLRLKRRIDNSFVYEVAPHPKLMRLCPPADFPLEGPSLPPDPGGAVLVPLE